MGSQELDVYGWMVGCMKLAFCFCLLWVSLRGLVAPGAGFVTGVEAWSGTLFSCFEVFWFVFDCWLWLLAFAFKFKFLRKPGGRV